MYINIILYIYRVWIKITWKLGSRPCMSSRVLTESFHQTKVVVEIRICGDQGLWWSAAAPKQGAESSVVQRPFPLAQKKTFKEVSRLEESQVALSAGGRCPTWGTRGAITGCGHNTFASSVFQQLGQRVAQRFWDVCATGDPKRAGALSEVDGRAEGTFTRPAVKTNR